MGAFSELNKVLDKKLVDKAIERGYSEDNILILQGREEELKSRYPQTWENLKSCDYLSDRRPLLEYAQDLVASWLFEDWLIDKLKGNGLSISHTGADKERKILPNWNVSSCSDASIVVKRKTVPLEIMCDYTGFWTRKNTIHLRDNKYQQLKKSSSLFLGFSTVDRQIILLDFSEDIKTEYIKSHKPYGYKPAYVVKVSSEMFFPFKIDRLVNELKNKCL